MKPPVVTPRRCNVAFYVSRACGHEDMETGPHQVLATTLTDPIPTRGDRLCPSYTDVPTKFLKRQARLISSFARRLCETSDSQSTERE